jgi:hypothetical protein
VGAAVTAPARADRQSREAVKHPRPRRRGVDDGERPRRVLRTTACSDRRVLRTTACSDRRVLRTTACSDRRVLRTTACSDIATIRSRRGFVVGQKGVAARLCPSGPVVSASQRDCDGNATLSYGRLGHARSCLSHARSCPGIQVTVRDLPWHRCDPRRVHTSFPRRVPLVRKTDPEDLLVPSRVDVQQWTHYADQPCSPDDHPGTRYVAHATLSRRVRFPTSQLGGRFHVRTATTDHPSAPDLRDQRHDPYDARPTRPTHHEPDHKRSTRWN